jgi:hypothetical protein
MFERAQAVESSYETFVTVLTQRSKLELVANVSRTSNKEILEITR